MVSGSGSSGTPLKDLSASRFSRLSELLDKSLEMSAEEREAWLADLDSSDPDAASQLRGLFASHGECRSEAFLEDRDLWIRQWASTLEAEPELVGKLFGPYRVLSLLGHGGMGSVWLAERVDGLFTRQVALKLVHPALMGHVMTERLTREREILAGLNHPNIARLLDAGFADDGQPYLALEYVAGTPLTAYCDSRRLSLRERLELFRQVLSAVQYAHAHLIIHRDLKPSNILVTDVGQAHLLDFGIAKLLSEGEAKETELTRLGGRALTPDYAAPEQIAGAPITTAADIYSLGVMLFELLTGERPYRLKRDSRGALEEAILQTEPVAPSHAALNEGAAQARGATAKKLARDLKGDLDTIANKALKKLPSERYASADAFGEDIARYLRGDVVLAQRDSMTYRALKFARRHRIAIAVVGVLILTLAGGLAATTYEAKIASAQRDAALQAQLRSLTQTAAARLKDADVAGALGIILEVLPHEGVERSYTQQALSVFQEARAVDAQVFAITGHADGVRSAAFSPDGQRIVTASFDKTARIWDAANGRQLVLFKGHTGRVMSAAFSPDGRRVVTASLDNTSRIWDAETGEQLVLLSGHTDRVYSAAFSPDGRRVITASLDRTARIWDAATGRQISLLSGHTDRVYSAAFSPDGRRVVTASYDKTARIWDSASSREILTLSGHTDWVICAAFSPDGQHIVTASEDKTARIWDAEAGRQIMTLSGHTNSVLSAAFSPDGRRIVTASQDRTARIWDTATGRQIMTLSGHTNALSFAAFSPDGRWIVTASSIDRSARVWDTAGEETMLLGGHTDRVSFAAFSPDGNRVITASTDKTARIWETSTGRELMKLSGHTQNVSFAVFSPDGKRVVTASFDRTARVWDTSTGQETFRLNGHTDRVESASFSPDGGRIVTASDDKTARLWDASTGRELMKLTGQDAVLCAAFSPDGRRVVTASIDKTARVWDASTGRQTTLLSGHTGPLIFAAFSPDGRRLVTASVDNTARIWDAATGREFMRLSGHSDWVVSAEFSSDGRRIVTASFDKTARIWDAATGRELKVFSGHTDRLASAQFSRDGQRVATASYDNTARIWDARAAALEVQIAWTKAAQFDSLPSAEQFDLGLPAASDVRQWPPDRSACDDAAAAPYDPDRRAPGVMLGQIAADLALADCADTDTSSNHEARSRYQHGRALLASGNATAARRDFEDAVARGYASAQVDLAMLLLRPSAEMRDIPRAVALYERAWKGGVTFAGFQLGTLYEQGLNRAERENDYLLAPDEARAWFWYQKAARAGEPNALARLAKKADGAAFSEKSPATRISYSLDAFKYFAAAADRARSEDWPDDAWRDWRYRRASLARLLARAGMMQPVANAFDEVRKSY